MANVKRVELVGLVPFHWTEDLDGSDLALLRPFLTPSWGLELKYMPRGYQDNANGGRTAMYELRVEGEEGMRYEWVEALVEIILKGGGEVSHCVVKDIEDISSVPVYIV